MSGQPREPIDACVLLSALAQRTWADLYDSAVLGHSLGEESITDYLVLALRRHFPHRNWMRQWSRRQEGELTGADWDWWLLYPGQRRGVGLRIQAKKIDIDLEAFAEFTAANKHGRQVEMLIESADEMALTRSTASTSPRFSHRLPEERAAAEQPCHLRRHGCQGRSAFTVSTAAPCSRPRSSRPPSYIRS
jgi:hypothetical protein